MGLLRRRRSEEVVPLPSPPSPSERERDFYGRAAKWLGTSAFTWTIWAFTGAPTGLPRGSGTHGHVVVTLGMWPAYLMVAGLVDLAKRAHALYVRPHVDGGFYEADETEGASSEGTAKTEPVLGAANGGVRF